MNMNMFYPNILSAEDFKLAENHPCLYIAQWLYDNHGLQIGYVRNQQPKPASGNPVISLGIVNPSTGWLVARASMQTVYKNGRERGKATGTGYHVQPITSIYGDASDTAISSLSTSYILQGLRNKDSKVAQGIANAVTQSGNAPSTIAKLMGTKLINKIRSEMNQNFTIKQEDQVELLRLAGGDIERVNLPDDMKQRLDEALGIHKKKLAHIVNGETNVRNMFAKPKWLAIFSPKNQRYVIGAIECSAMVPGLISALSGGSVAEANNTIVENFHMVKEFEQLPDSYRDDFMAAIVMNKLARTPGKAVDPNGFFPETDGFAEHYEANSCSLYDHDRNAALLFDKV